MPWEKLAQEEIMLDASLIVRCNDIAASYKDDQFFLLHIHDGTWLLFNWTFGVTFKEREVQENSRPLNKLMEQADLVASSSETKQEIIHHLIKRGWMDMLVGTGVYLDAECVAMNLDELEIFRGYEMPVVAFTTDSGRRYFIKEGYLDLAMDIIGGGMTASIFKPLLKPSYPHDYRPMIFFNEDGHPAGLCYTVSEENMRNPTNRTLEYQEEVERHMPELRELR